MKIDSYTPDELLAKYKSIRSQVPAKIFYSKPKYRKTMELWCAAQLGRAYTANIAPCSILIHKEDAQTYFDFQLEIDTQKLDFQLTEVQLAGRRRGDEYRKGDPSGCATVDHYDKGENLGGEWISSAIKQKLVKYGGDVSKLNLLVYVNYLAEEHPYQKLREQVANDALPFRSVWLLNWNAIACVATKDIGLDAQTGWMFSPNEPHDNS